MKQPLKSSQPQHFQSKRPISMMFSRYYWLQIGLIAFAVIFGLTCSGFIIKRLLLKTALEQEAAHYWVRYDKDHNAALPDTKNLYGYRWTNNPPIQVKSLKLEHGVHRLIIDGNDRVTMYDEHDGNKLLLVFGESNVNRLIWLFGLAPLMFSLIILYSVLWFINRKAHRHLSPVTQLAQAIQNIDLHQPKLNKHPFQKIQTRGNLEAEELRIALQIYHQTLIEFIEREQQFTAEVSHELRTPLSVIKGGLELLQYKFPEQATIPRMQNMVIDMQLLMDTLLTIARQGSTPLPTSPIDLTISVRKICEDLQDIFAARGMDYDIKSLADNIPIVNPATVTMIFSNIIRNALNYSQGKRVLILIDAHRIVIEDDGVGLSPAALDALQQHGETRHIESHRGHGIGLKLVKRLCNMSGWEIELMNKSNIKSNQAAPQTVEGLSVVIYTS
ncbi:MAG: HAMP domain-containing histidine kinase [Gammaproteobacteria bacterium]|nr:HAMP domain-containing histidine kinase [Gammaproteobacteria bacterium]